jgi:hypothetical protein
MESLNDMLLLHSSAQKQKIDKSVLIATGESFGDLRTGKPGHMPIKNSDIDATCGEPFKCGRSIGTLDGSVPTLFKSASQDFSGQNIIVGKKYG